MNDSQVKKTGELSLYHLTEHSDAAAERLAKLNRLSINLDNRPQRLARPCRRNPSYFVNF